MDFLQQYEEIANRYGFQYEDYRQAIHVLGYYHGLDVKMNFCILYNEKFVFIAYDMYTPGAAFMSATYSGLYAAIDMPEGFEARVSRRIPLMDMFRKPVYGDPDVDKNVTIKTNDLELFRKVIDKEVVKSYLEVWDEGVPADILFAKNLLLEKRIKLLENEVVVGVEYNKFLEPAYFERTYTAMSGLIEKITGKAAKLHLG